MEPGTGLALGESDFCTRGYIASDLVTWLGGQDDFTGDCCTGITSQTGLHLIR